MNTLRFLHEEPDGLRVPSDHPLMGSDGSWDPVARWIQTLRTAPYGGIGCVPIMLPVLDDETGEPDFEKWIAFQAYLVRGDQICKNVRVTLDGIDSERSPAYPAELRANLESYVDQTQMEHRRFELMIRDSVPIYLAQEKLPREELEAFAPASLSVAWTDKAFVQELNKIACSYYGFPTKQTDRYGLGALVTAEYFARRYRQERVANAFGNPAGMPSIVPKDAERLATYAIDRMRHVAPHLGDVSLQIRDVASVEFDWIVNAAERASSEDWNRSRDDAH